MVFLVLRQKIDTVQAILTVEEEKVSKRMVKWASGLPDESIVLVEGIVDEPKEEVKSVTVGDVEIKITQVRGLETSLHTKLKLQADTSYFTTRSPPSIHSGRCFAARQ